MMRNFSRTLLLLMCMSLVPAAALADHARLLEIRRQLLSDLDKRQKADSRTAPGRDLHLFLDEGADGQAMQLVLRQRAGQWSTVYATVPAWYQGTMQEWRGFHLANGAGAAWRPTINFPGDAAGLRLDAASLSGSLKMQFLLDQTLEEKHPPGRKVSWWDRFVAVGNTIPRSQTYAIDAAISDSAHAFEMVLEGGVQWDSKLIGGKGTGVVIRPIFLRVQVPSTRFTVTQISTPTWNGGYHEADATGLRMDGGRLTGSLLVLLHQDGWVPFGGGKTLQHDPIIVRFEIDATLKHHALAGTFKATMGGSYKGLHYTKTGDPAMATNIPETKYEGVVRGRGGRAVIGRYRSEGDLGVRVGNLDGMVLDDPAPLDQQLPLPPAEKVNDLLHQIRALHLALQHYPLPIDQAMAQMDTAAPAWPDKPDAAQLDAYCRAAAELLDSALPPDAAPVPSARQCLIDSPSLGATALPATDGIATLDAKAGWHFIADWQILGPFEQRIGLEGDTAYVPDIVPVAGLGYAQTADRFGAKKGDTSALQWQAVKFETPRISAPDAKKGFYTRFSGQVWYATAHLRSESASKVWLRLESGDFAKLWVNGKLVWSDSEKPWRYRARGATIVAVDLPAGDSRLLARIHRDRSPAWMRLAITAREPAPLPQPPLPAAAVRNPWLFPDATPPLAWDISKGINVAWRSAELAGNTRPLVHGDALYVTSAPDKLHCIDPATGEARWTAEAGAAAATALTEPVTDGKNIYVHAGNAACFDATGKRLWSVPTQLGKARIFVHGNRVVLEGEALAAKGKSKSVGVVILDAANGQEHARLTIPGGYDNDVAQLLTFGPAAVLVSCTGAVIDISTGKLQGMMDVEFPSEGQQAGGQIIGPPSGRSYATSFNGTTLFMTSQAQSAAVRVWARDGKLGYSQLWESNYEHGGFGSFVAPCIATDKYLFTWMPVLERGPHCPDARLELHVQDVLTGRPLARLKPALENAVQHEVQPAIAGGYVFCTDSGGGSHGGLQGNGQIAIATADEHAQLICRNLIDIGTRVAPVFAGNRMFLRSPKALTCIAVATDDGKRYQAQRLAETVLAEVGGPPVLAAPAQLQPAADIAPGPDVPIGKLIDGRATDHWIGAGPFEVLDSDAVLAALRPTAGSEVRFGRQTARFQVLWREYAFNDPPLFGRVFELQGTGDLIPTFSTRVDPRCVSGPGGAGLLYTVLDNARDRYVVPTLNANGVTMWLAGHEVRSGEPLHLPPGLFPLLVRVTPDYYKADASAAPAAVAVAKALEAGAIDKIAWPKTWQVIGPLPPDAAPLQPEQLRDVPRNMKIGDRAFPPYEFPADGDMVNLMALADLPPDTKPDIANAPKVRPIGAPAVAWAFAAVEAPADGFLYISASADWFMRWHLDGQVVYDTLPDGNAAAANDVNAHPFAVPVTKGRHMLAVQVRPGSKGWSFSSIGGFSTKPAGELAAYRAPSWQKKQSTDPRFAPAFKEIPHPPTRQAQWMRTLALARPRLEAIVTDLPGTDEARQAQALLAQVPRQ